MPKFGNHFVRENRMVFSFSTHRLKCTNTLLYLQSFPYICSILKHYKMINKTLTYCFFLFFAYSCKNVAPSEQINAITEDTVPTFKVPEIPTIFSSSEQQAEFLVNHYWDYANLSDTNFIHHPDIIEQAWTDYCHILNYVPLDIAQSAIKELMKNAGKEKKVYDYLTNLADKYLYDPNAPSRNEEFYIPVLESMVNSPLLNEAEKIRPEARLKLAQKNRMGTKAINLVYTLASGKKGTLYQIYTEYTILFINNPGCHACAEAIDQLRSAEIIKKLLENKRLSILAIYPDEELDKWKQHIKDYPEDWINGYDKEQMINNKELYDLKAIPTLYLLDKNKVVLLKDATFSSIVDYLYRI